MKTLQIFSLITMMSCLTTVSFSQATKESFKVSGECGMCKKKIENAAREGGAAYALWNSNSKELVVKYNSTSTNTAKI